MKNLKEFQDYLENIKQDIEEIINLEKEEDQDFLDFEDEQQNLAIYLRSRLTSKFVTFISSKHLCTSIEILNLAKEIKKIYKIIEERFDVIS